MQPREGKSHGIRVSMLKRQHKNSEHKTQYRFMRVMLVPQIIGLITLIISHVVAHKRYSAPIWLVTSTKVDEVVNRGNLPGLTR